MSSDSSRFAEVAAECARSSSEALESIKKFSEVLKTDSEREGISLLEVKNREMLAYMTGMSLMMGSMSAGKSLISEPAVLRAIKHRTVLERIRPIESKMKTQIDKLALLDSNESVETTKVLRAKPEQMELDSDSSENEEDDFEKTTKKYVPPKMMAVHYDEPDDPRVNKQQEKAKRRALQSSLIQELKQQYSDAPVEFREVSQRQYEADRERERYEEDNFVRLKFNKADRAKEAKRNRGDAIDDLLNFGNYMMRGEDGDALDTKRKKAGGGPPKKKGKFDRSKIKQMKNKSKQKRIKRRQ